MITLNRAYNFNAGPSALPLPVLQLAQEELVNFKNTGMSVMELSHRSKEFEDVLTHAKETLTELLNIPDTHEILFLQGGASLQFSMIPMNFLADIKEFIDNEGNIIKWEHIKILHNVQEEEGLKFANKLSKGHVQFHRQKMNVKVAAQTLSSSVADAIEYLMKSCHPQCSDAHGTIKFIRIVD